MTETPGTLNQKFKGAGGFVKQAIVWAAIAKLHPEIKPTGLTVCRDTAAPVAEIASSIAAAYGAEVNLYYDRHCRGRFLPGPGPADALDSALRQTGRRLPDA